jgi:SH3-like domain-containing protein
VTIRGLKKGEQFVLVSQNGSWLEIKDASGKNGWVNNNPQYVRISKK